MSYTGKRSSQGMLLDTTHSSSYFVFVINLLLNEATRNKDENIKHITSRIVRICLFHERSGN